MRLPTIEPLEPSIDEASAAQRLSEMTEGEAGDVSISVTITRKGKEQIVHLTKEDHPALTQALFQIAKGKAVIVLPFDEELSTQQAADMLNVSRPFLIKLLENNEIPFRTVGTWRRIRLGDVLAYKHKSLEERKAILREMTALNQEMGLYD